MPANARYTRHVGSIPGLRRLPWKRTFLPEEFHGQKSVVGYSPWGHEESDMTEHAHTHMHTHITFYLVFTVKVSPITKHYHGLPRWVRSKEHACQRRRLERRDSGLIPGSGITPGEGNGNPLRYCCRKNPMDRGSLWATVHGVTKSQTQLNQLSTHASIIMYEILH